MEKKTIKILLIIGLLSLSLAGNFVSAANNATQVIEKDFSYTNINEKYEINVSEYIATLFAGIGLYFVLRGVAGRGGFEAVPFRK